MKKVLLVTLQGANIGNRLQNYALQTVLKEMGTKVYTPYYNIPEMDSLKKRIVHFIKFHLGIIPTSKYRHEYIVGKRRNKFRQFDKKYIAHMFKCSFGDNVYRKSGCDYAITGSDQVWHKWSNNNNELNYFYLKSVPFDKRISYAPSFGFDQFPICDIDVHKSNLLEMKHLSCRENSAVDLIFNLTARKAKVLVDPCLLIEKEQWNSMEKKPQIISGSKFALVYFLGNKNEYIDSIRKFCEEEGLYIVDIFDSQVLKYYYTTPDEFIWLIHNSQYVFTDSFHAVLFSIMYEKKFLSFKRLESGMGGMYGRMETLLNLYGIDNHCYCGDINLVKQDYIKNNIERKREEALSYIKEALELA